ncbi:RidA family protein [Paenibacillus aurantius]|uniref:RidA family protein n=1 Tax=Paenibacillus aurantius TaxID=2918900 RepID=A0AA96RGB6_9BACL|nr:RidA family protein [Paenibacillus aurantius]WNQ12356.1 RidA family protein [Paenibacillus aurantius]
MRQAIFTKDASPGDGPYSQAIVSKGFLFVSGQGPINPQGYVTGETIEEQARLTLDNIVTILQAAHCSMDHVVKVNVILSDMSHFGRFNEVYKEYFEAPMPARTCFGGELDGILVEIDVIAALPE